MKILLLNGPNLNMLGQREPEIYGTDTVDDIVVRLQKRASELGAEVLDLQSNHEGSLIDFIQTHQATTDAMLINPGAFGHYSYAIRDAISGSRVPTWEVHITNVHARESFRETMVISAVCKGVIAGFGWRGYLYALEAAVAHLKGEK